ncbi:hypothetical protein VTN77DRAFT_511 [Rasamsonia byssochlamydoides]|uniref:uncharacterized protein n=1 Tax=Rasamsonia byssochlamydoides TaxID=89139 RepID=UPI0037448C6B
MDAEFAKKLERLRPVGPLEEYSTARHHLRFYFNVAVTATYRLSEGAVLPIKNHIYRACEILIAQHSNLAAIPVDEGTRAPYFARLPEIDLDKCVSFQQRSQNYAASHDPEQPSRDVELDELLQIQHNTPFSPGLPYWRLCILTDPADVRQFTAVFVYHHAIGDGSSGKAFHNTFTRALREVQLLPSGVAKNPVIPPTSPLLPSLEEVMPLPVSMLYLAKEFLYSKIGPRNDPLLWTGSHIKAPLTNLIRHVVLSKSTTMKLRKACQMNGTTVTAALQAMIARVIFNHVPATFKKLRCSGAISLRRWLLETITEDSIGVWVQEYEEVYERDNFNGQEFPWDEARRSRRTIEHVLEQKGRNQSIGLLKYVSDYHRDLFLSKVGKPRHSSFELSNIGAYVVDSDSPPHAPEVGRMVFSQSANVTGSALAVSAITGGDGCLVLSFTWQKDVLESDFIKTLIDGLKQGLDELVV